MFNFIEYFKKYYEQRESPDSFWEWAAIGCIAAVLRNNVFIRALDDKVFPNVFIILLADSGLTRKAAPCRAASNLVRAVGNTKFIAGRNSIQAVLKELAKEETDERGNMKSGASALLYSEELSSFLVSDPSAVSILTDLYDYHEDWPVSLIHAGSYDLKEVCVTLLCASNTRLFSEVYTDMATEGGLLGRTFIVKEERPRRRTSLLDLQYNHIPKEPLIKHLKKLALKRGEVIVMEDAKEYYNQWYHKIPEEIFLDRVGYGSRLGTHVLKLAMILGAARQDFNLTIKLEDIAKAIELCIGLKKNYKQIAFGSGMSSRSRQAAIVIKLLLEQKDYIMTWAELLRVTIGDIEGEVLEAILKYMEGAKLVRSTSYKGEVAYQLTDKAIKLFIKGEET